MTVGILEQVLRAALAVAIAAERYERHGQPSYAAVGQLPVAQTHFASLVLANYSARRMQVQRLRLALRFEHLKVAGEDLPALGIGA